MWLLVLQRLRLLSAPITQLGRGVTSGFSDGYSIHRGAIGIDLGPHIAERRRVEAHPDDRVAAFGTRFVHQPSHCLVAALGQVFGHALQLATEHRFESDTELGKSISRSDGEAKDFAADTLNLPTGNVIGSNDKHQTTFLQKRDLGWFPLQSTVPFLQLLIQRHAEYTRSTEHAFKTMLYCYGSLSCVGWFPIKIPAWVFLGRLVSAPFFEGT